MREGEHSENEEITATRLKDQQGIDVQPLPSDTIIFHPELVLFSDEVKTQATHEAPIESPAIREETGMAARSDTFFQQSLWMEGDGCSELREKHTRRQLHERLQTSDVSTLSNEELLAIVLGNGSISKGIIEKTQALFETYSLHDLLRAEFGELCQRFSIGEAKAAQLQAVLEIARRLTIPATNERYTIRSVLDAVNLLQPDMAFLDHEQMRVLVLDTKNGVAANLLLYRGTVNSSVLRVSEVFRPAITRKCPNIIVSHNHPSGNVTPSPEDIEVTKLMIEAAKFLEIDLLDHIIIGGHRYHSLKEQLRW